jgi:hypothetical protein
MQALLFHSGVLIYSFCFVVSYGVMDAFRTIGYGREDEEDEYFSLGSMNILHPL